MVLETVADYLAESRILLQDTVAPYRYSDDSIVTGLNMAFYEVSRLRPDLIQDQAYLVRMQPTQTSLDRPFKTYSATLSTEKVLMPTMYRVSLIYYMAGNAQLRDTDDTQDKRAAMFLAKFTAQMLNIAA